VEDEWKQKLKNAASSDYAKSFFPFGFEIDHIGATINDSIYTEGQLMDFGKFISKFPAVNQEVVFTIIIPYLTICLQVAELNVSFEQALGDILVEGQDKDLIQMQKQMAEGSWIDYTFKCNY
jgi:hypothetical protein